MGCRGWGGVSGGVHEFQCALSGWDFDVEVRLLLTRAKDSHSHVVFVHEAGTAFAYVPTQWLNASQR